MKTDDPNVEIIDGVPHMDGVPIGQIHHMNSTEEIFPDEKIWWKITIGQNYGSFLYWGTQDEAEKRRRAKARWERAIGKKKPATEEEIRKHLKQPISIRRGADGFDYSKEKK